jgi:hypothetical protein
MIIVKPPKYAIDCGNVTSSMIVQKILIFGCVCIGIGVKAVGHEKMP